jgi:hypothetical protein
MENEDYGQNTTEEINRSNQRIEHPQADEAQQLTSGGVDKSNRDTVNSSLAPDGPVSRKEGDNSADLSDIAKTPDVNKNRSDNDQT